MAEQTFECTRIPQIGFVKKINFLFFYFLYFSWTDLRMYSHTPEHWLRARRWCCACPRATGPTGPVCTCPAATPQTRWSRLDLCVYVCVCVCMCVYMCIQVYRYVYILYAHVCIYIACKICIHTICTCMHIYTHILYAHVCIYIACMSSSHAANWMVAVGPGRIYVYTCIHVYVYILYIHICRRMHKYVWYIYMYMHRHTRTCTYTEPTRSSPCSAPDKKTVGVSALRKALFPTCTTYTSQGLSIAVASILQCTFSKVSALVNLLHKGI